MRSFFFCAICAVLCVGHINQAFCSSVEGVHSHPSSTHGKDLDENEITEIDPADDADDSIDGETDSVNGDAPIDNGENPLPESKDLADNNGVGASSKRDVVGKRNLWPHRDALWYKEEDRDGENVHLPYVHSVADLYKHAFYCAISNDVVGLNALIGELRTLGDGLDFLLEELRTKEGDNLLLHAVKNDSIDVVRYLLSIGSEVDVVDGYGNTPLDIAVSIGNIAMVNSIAEMKIQFKFEMDGEG